MDLPPGTQVDGFIPRAATGFQVKQQDMPAGEIDREMRPKGVLRPSIQALADQGGAYIIVSSQGSLADTALTDRRGAMTRAVNGAPNANSLALDFYDRRRIAEWVQTHEGLIPWVRELVGRRIQGWHSYGSWANLSEPISAEYLVDEKFRIHTSKRDSEDGISAIEGIRQLRDRLRAARSVVRLVGLSGVGKTRLVQALFDDRVGDQSLDPAAAIYSNIGGEIPDPQPVALASHLVLTRTKAILVVDNCGADLHERLSQVCRQPQSNVSLITVEYDIQDDQPEGTEVFRLDTSSPELIEKLLHLRFPELSQVDTRTIAESSDGNARVAIAIAGTIEQNETVAGMNHQQLFERLFVQRQSPDQLLYVAAQACSLLYSFNGEDLSDDENAELIRLAALVGMTPDALYRYLAVLQERGLVQRRGVWRAVLPHAIANRLAPLALKGIPIQLIEQQLLSTDRLMGSFARRIGYLHKSAEAVQIVKRWLGPGGLLADIAEFNDLGRSMLNRVAPVAPDSVLDALERACDQQPAKCEPYVDLVRSIAYDPPRFARSIELLVRAVAVGNPDERSHGRDVFESLFQMHLSGTHAPIERRLEILESLLNSPDPKRQTLGVRGLRAVLEASHYASVSQFDFGARPRDYGYWPSRFEEIRHWFISALSLIERFVLRDVAVTPQMRALLADSFRGVWSRGCVCDELASLYQRIGDQRFWCLFRRSR